MRNRAFLSFFILLTAARATPTVPLEKAEARFFEAYDAQDDGNNLEIPKVAAHDRPAMLWLAGAATQEAPANPFRKGSAAWREAESLRRLAALPAESWPRALESQPLSLSGSRLAFWRWGQPRVRDGRMDAELRQRWENKLLASGTTDLIFEYALRHALCFALAEGDEPRFTQLKDLWSEQVPDLFLDFQRAFALLGSPSPVFNLWKLPEINSEDLSLKALGAHRIWIATDSEKGLPDLPTDTAWIVPTKLGLQPEGQFTLLEPGLSEARSLSARLQEAKRAAFLAPTRKPFETYALMYFPILVELDSQGLIRKIRMGDAALAKAQ